MENIYAKTRLNDLGLRPAVREMARNNLIEDPQIWFEFIEARNKSSHSYDEDIAQSVFSVIRKFSVEVAKLVSILEKQ